MLKRFHFSGRVLRAIYSRSSGGSASIMSRPRRIISASESSFEEGLRADMLAREGTNFGWKWLICRPKVYNKVRVASLFPIGKFLLLTICQCDRWGGARPLFPPASGPVTGSFTGLHWHSNFLAFGVFDPFLGGHDASCFGVRSILGSRGSNPPTE